MSRAMSPQRPGAKVRGETDGTGENPCSPTSPSRSPLSVEVQHHQGTDPFLADAIAKVMAHYRTSAACIALEGPSELHVVVASGMSRGRLPLESIARHTTGRPLPTIISDAAADERFIEDCLVVGPPHTRFFVGAPISVGPSDKYVGTLCLLDNRERQDCALDYLANLMEEARRVAKHLEQIDILPVVGGQYQDQPESEPGTP